MRRRGAAGQVDLAGAEAGLVDLQLADSPEAKMCHWRMALLRNTTCDFRFQAQRQAGAVETGNRQCRDLLAASSCVSAGIPTRTRLSGVLRYHRSTSVLPRTLATNSPLLAAGGV